MYMYNVLDVIAQIINCVLKHTSEHVFDIIAHVHNCDLKQGTHENLLYRNKSNI